ncbi:MAG: CheR family methyltransferase [Geminicoccaceae bacterium]
MKLETFAFARSFLKRRSGLVLGDDKRDLLENRLLPVARNQSYATLDELIERLRSGDDERLERAIVDAMTTNETSFFRDGYPFELFAGRVLPALLKARENQPIRIWSAAASTGQEPYSIAICLAEAGIPACSAKILATDLSFEALERARAGIYSQTEIRRGLPPPLLDKYFVKDQRNWKVKNCLKQRVRFRAFNLLDLDHQFGRFDVIFCRNVLIYFEPSTKADILKRLADLLEADGFLVLGATERVEGASPAFRPLGAERKGVFQPVVALDKPADARSLAQAIPRRLNTR